MPLPLSPRSRLSSSPSWQDRSLDWVQYAADLALWAKPQRQPTATQLRAGKLIAHRGAHRASGPIENTLAAFDAAVAAGAWGLEFDVRWTRDLVPVISHDGDGERCFGRALTIAELDFATLRRELPAIPTLAEMVARYGGRQHFMIEVKVLPWVDKTRQWAILRETLAPLTAGRDYHWLALDLDFLADFTLDAAEFRLPVAILTVRPLAEAALRCGYAGVAGHALLMSDSLLAQFRGKDQQVGVGFPASANAFKRELNRGVEWIFTNDIGRLGPLQQRWLRETAP